MLDPAQIIKAQIGELMWNNAILSSELEKLKKELEEKKDKTDA